MRDSNFEPNQVWNWDLQPMWPEALLSGISFLSPRKEPLEPGFINHKNTKNIIYLVRLLSQSRYIYSYNWCTHLVVRKLSKFIINIYMHPIGWRLALTARRTFQARAVDHFFPACRKKVGTWKRKFLQCLQRPVIYLYVSNLCYRSCEQIFRQNIHPPVMHVAHERFSRTCAWLLNYFFWNLTRQVLWEIFSFQAELMF
jgi:hypothetical protein